MWSEILFRPVDDPELRNCGDEPTQGVVITYVDDLMITGRHHHIDAISSALLAASRSVPGLFHDGIDFLGARITRNAHIILMWPRLQTETSRY